MADMPVIASQNYYNNMFNILKYFGIKVASVNAFMYMRVLSGCYSGFECGRLVRYAASIYCAAVRIVVVTTQIYIVVTIVNQHGLKSFDVYMIVQTIEYICYSLIEICSEGEHFYKCINEIKSYNSKTIDIDATISGCILYIYLGVQYLLLHIMLCDITFNSPVGKLLRFLIAVFVDLGTRLNSFAAMIAFELSWRRVKMLATAAHRSIMKVRRGDDDGSFEEDTRCWLRQYRYLLNMTMFNNTPMQLSILVQSIVSVLVGLVVLYNAIINARYSTVHKVILFGRGLQMCQLFLSAVLMSLAGSHVEHLHMCVRRMLSRATGTDTDDSRRRALEDASTYLRLRPLKYEVCGMFELDVSYIIAMLSLVTTCVIVLVQFTHVFG